jgi:type III restriction enzyme
MFGDRGRALVTRSLLTQEFELSKQNTEINFESVDTEFYKIDLEDSNIPKKIKVNKAAAEKFVQAVDLLPPQARVSQIGKKVCEDLNEKYDEIASDEIEAYVGRIIQSLNAEQLDTFKENYISYVERIKDKIDSLLEDYRVQRLEKLLDRDEIRVENVTKFSDTIILLNKTSEYSKTLYDAELNDMNGEEINAIEKIMALDNVKWWHRNGSKNNIWAYCINGYVNHYPDFIIETTKGKILFVEYKGYQLATKENELKLRLGELLEAYGNKWFKYYMVFDKEAKFKGSFNLQDALDDISYQ